MSRLESILASGIIALSGCAAAQPKVEQKIVVRDANAERHPKESICDYEGRIGIYDPEGCENDKKFEEDMARISRVVANMVADVFWARSSGYVNNCLYVQQYDAKTLEQRKEKCIGEVLDIIDADPNFQKIESTIQEMIRQRLIEKIMEK